MPRIIIHLLISLGMNALLGYVGSVKVGQIKAVSEQWALLFALIENSMVDEAVTLEEAEDIEAGAREAIKSIIDLAS